MLLKILRYVLIFVLVFQAAEFIKESNLIQVVTEELKDLKMEQVTVGFDSIIKIKSSAGSCSAIIIDRQYALTAAHCLYLGMLGGIDKDETYFIYDNLGNLISAKAKAVALDQHRDVALIKGDFTGFKTTPVDFTGQAPVVNGTAMLSCGFPAGQKTAYCIPLYYTGSHNFQMTARGGPIFRGCSGGPVFNYNTGKVIGVNSAVSGSNIIIGPVTGVLAEFGVL